MKKITQEDASISWDAPLIDGGSEVFNYRVEKREATHRAWTVVLPEVHKTACKVCF